MHLTISGEMGEMGNRAVTQKGMDEKNDVESTEVFIQNDETVMQVCVCTDLCEGNSYVYIVCPGTYMIF